MPLSQPFRFVALLALILCAAVAHSAPARSSAGPRNLLLNPGFERGFEGHEWMPAGWDTSDAGLPTVFFGRDSFLVHGGRYAVSVANTSTLYPMSHNWSQTILVGRESWGRTAVLTVWTKSNGQQGRAYILAQAYRDSITRMSRVWGVGREDARRRMGINKVNDPAIDLGWSRTQFDEANTDWVKRETRTYVPVGTNVLFVRFGLMGSGQLLIDDASLTLEATSPAAPLARKTNLLRDPDFEAGGLAWEWVTPPFEGARIDLERTLAHGGTNSMRFSNMRDGLAQTRMGVCQPFAGRAFAGKRVRASAFFRADSLKGVSFVKIYAQGPKGLLAQSPGGLLLSDTFDWTENSAELEIPKGTEQLWVWFLLNAPAEGTLWVDDARFEIVGGAEPAAKARPTVRK
ncbi:MAG: hypothetical protein ABIU54_00425 [Candidatus Eisenbacteria bacterium]